MASYGIEVGNGHDALIQKNCESPAENEMGRIVLPGGRFLMSVRRRGKVNHENSIFLFSHYT